MERLPEVQSAVGSALLTLGDGNWKMGEGVQVGKGAKLGEGDEPVILEHYVCGFVLLFIALHLNAVPDDVVTTAINSLNTLSRTSKRPAFGSIFLLNNISYLRKHILLDPHHEMLITLLSQPTKDALNSNFRMAKAAYFDSNFSPLMQALADDPKEKAGKAATKEKFTRFFDLLEEVMERHKFAKVLEDDDDGRETIGDEVTKLVVPSLQRFTQKHREKEFSKSKQSFFRLAYEHMLMLVFDG